MALRQFCPSCLSSISRQLATSTLRRAAFANPSILPSSTIAQFHTSPDRSAASSSKGSKSSSQKKAPKRKKGNNFYANPDLRDAIQFSLVDAMRYLRAAEVGRSPTSSKYELHIRLRTPKNGPVVRNRLRLPHPVRTDVRIAVVCPPDSAAGKAAVAAGATLVGEDNIIDAVRDGRIEFDRCLCHQDSLAKLSKSGIARVLGPRGLMPSAKLGTVVKDVGSSVKSMVGGSEYRERLGVVRMAIGQLGFTPEEVQRNIRSFVEAVKRDAAALNDRVTKDIAEVVLSSTNGPGMSLTGEFRAAESPPTKDLSTL